MKIVHLFYYTFPNLSGYAIRSRHIVEKQLQRGLSPMAISHPVMMGLGARDHETIGGVAHRRLTSKGSLLARAQRPLLLREGAIIRALIQEATTFLGADPPDILHAHSPHIMAHTALGLRQTLGCPVIYEVRGLWEDSAAVRGDLRPNSRRYLHHRRRETEALRSADGIVVISAALKRELLERGLSEEKIIVVPNGADPRPDPPARDPELARRLGVEGGVNLGYVGSLTAIEDLNLLLRAFARIASAEERLRLIFVGDGPRRKELERDVQRLGLSARVRFAGSVPHDAIWDYYGLLDIVVVPRSSNRVADIVTPIKPLEAMAAGRALLVSRVGGLLEIVREGETALTYPPGDDTACAGRLLELLRSSELRLRLGATARAWVVQSRTWTHTAALYDDLYRRLARRSRRQTPEPAPAGRLSSRPSGSE